MTFTMIEQYLGGVQMAKFEFLNISRLYSVLIFNRKYFGMIKCNFLCISGPCIISDSSNQLEPRNINSKIYISVILVD